MGKGVGVSVGVSCVVGEGGGVWGCGCVEEVREGAAPPCVSCRTHLSQAKARGYGGRTLDHIHAPG